MRNSFLFFVSIIVLGACTVFPEALPAKLYALDVPTLQPTVNCPISFSLREVKVPGYLDRSELVLSQEGYKIRTSAQHLWAAPLSTELTRLTAKGLQELLGMSVVRPYPIRQLEKPDWIMSIEISRLVNAKGLFQMEITTSGQRFSKTETFGIGSSQGSLGKILTTSSMQISSEATGNSAAEQVAEAISELLAQNLKKISIELGNTICRTSG
jgi:uncharacterized lipoprotein YmbA